MCVCVSVQVHLLENMGNKTVARRLHKPQALRLSTSDSKPEVLPWLAARQTVSIAGLCLAPLLRVAGA